MFLEFLCGKWGLGPKSQNEFAIYWFSTPNLSAGRTCVVSAGKTSAVSAGKTSLVSQDISMPPTTTRSRARVVGFIVEMSWETRDVLAADTADVLAADTRDVLAADTRDVLAADTTDVLAADITPCSWSCSTSDGLAAPVMVLQHQ